MSRTWTIEFTEDQLNALDALLGCIHYDDLATDWFRRLPLPLLKLLYTDPDPPYMEG